MLLSSSPHNRSPISTAAPSRRRSSRAAPRGCFSRMVESILSFTRDDAKQEARSLVDLSALVEGICEDAMDAGEKVIFSGPRDVTVSCRPMAMRRAISNLVDNAIKYGGRADVTLAAEDDRGAISSEIQSPGIAAKRREDA